MDKSYSAFANLSLAKHYLTKGDTDKAIGYLNKITDDSFASAPKHERMGDVMLRRGQVKKAMSAYKRSLEVNSGLRRPRQKLIRIYRKMDPEEAKTEYEKLKYILSFYDFSRRNSPTPGWNKGDILNK